MRTLIRDAQIFDGSGQPARAGSVLVNGNRIARVAFGADALSGEPADRVIDAAGRTLMPGMVEAHAHLTWGSSVEKIYHQFILPADELKVAAWRNARVLLDHGFTSARTIDPPAGNRRHRRRQTIGSRPLPRDGSNRRTRSAFAAAIAARRPGTDR